MKEAFDRGEECRGDRIETAGTSVFVAADLAEEGVEVGASSVDDVAVDGADFGLKDGFCAKGDPAGDGARIGVGPKGEVGVEKAEEATAWGAGVGDARVDDADEAFGEGEEDLLFAFEVVVDEAR